MAHVPGKLLVYWKENAWAAPLAAPSFHVPVSWYSSTEFKHGCGIGLMYIIVYLYFYLFDLAIKIMDIGIIILDFNSRIF